MVNTEIRWIILFAAKRWESSIQSAKIRLGADCDSDHELLITKFRLKLKKVGKTTRPFRYDPNKVPFNYSWEKAMATHCKTLAWKISWMEEPGRLQSMGSLRAGHN